MIRRLLLIVISCKMPQYGRNQPQPNMHLIATAFLHDGASLDARVMLNHERVNLRFPVYLQYSTRLRNTGHIVSSNSRDTVNHNRYA
jgi:hypothetical protein